MCIFVSTTCKNVLLVWSAYNIRLTNFWKQALARTWKYILAIIAVVRFSKLELDF